MALIPRKQVRTRTPDARLSAYCFRPHSGNLSPLYNWPHYTQLQFTRKGFVVHHKDFNKLNNSVDNLAYITHSKHSKLHSIHNWEEVRAKGIKYKRGYTRKDIPDDEIRKMLDDGVPVKAIAGFYKCHSNTIYERIKKWNKG